MSSTLYNRLKRIKEANRSLTKPTPPVFKLQVEKNSPWTLVAPGVWELRTRRPLALELPMIHRGLGNDGQSSWAWFDTETTGLSGGAGTVLFLFGLAYPIAEGWECTQVFLEDYPFESAFLLRIQELVSNFRGLASYNGSTFDLPLLRTRFVMNGLPWNPPHHVDLLRPVRRAWRDSLTSCSLGTLENQVLKLERLRDVPGKLVPEIFQSYLRNGAGDPGGYRPLDDVFAHHLSDHWSMIQLTETLGHILYTVEKRVSEPRLRFWGLTRLGLLRLWLGQGNLRGADDQFRFILDQEIAPGEGLSAYVAQIYWRLGEKGASEPWLLASVDVGSLWALEKLTIYYEHWRKEPHKALEVIVDFQNRWSTRWKQLSSPRIEQWQARIARLTRKCGQES